GRAGDAAGGRRGRVADARHAGPRHRLRGCRGGPGGAAAARREHRRRAGRGQRGRSAVTGPAGATVLVTGASSGIGKAIAEHFADAGWRVFGTSRRARPARAGAARPSADRAGADRPSADRASINRPGASRSSVDRSGVDPPGIEMLCLDVRSGESVAECVAQVLDRAGQIDVLVNNAGVMHLGMVEETTLDEARAVLETNFFGVVRLTNAVL